MDTEHGRVAVADAGRTDIARHFSPPFDLTSDMLFVMGLCPTGPLRTAFPRVPFLSVLGRTPLVAWFSLVKQVCYTAETGERQCMGGPDAAMYNELNVLALLRQRAFFVPGIYATSELTIQVGRSQGMPKMPTLMSLRVNSQALQSSVLDGNRSSSVRARMLGTGRFLGKLLSVAWPVRMWPALFPSGNHVRASILETPSAQLALVGAGKLSVEAEWLPQPVNLFPLGLFLPDLRMSLPQSKQVMHF